jgi:Bacterial membrane protein YfhO
MMRKILSNPFVFFTITSIVFFWPISLHLFSFKNDTITYYYPIRTLISDALNNGELPLWTPYLNMGYPLHADLQSGAWNPIIWIFSFSTKYNLAAFHTEFLFYTTFAGIGFYYLIKEFGCTKYVALIVALAYQSSGFVIDMVQFFNCMSGACFLPFIFLYFRRILFAYTITDALLLAFFMFLLFTGGYPSLFIITTYLLMVYGFFHFYAVEKKFQYIKKIYVPISIAILCFVILSLPAIISFVNHLPEINRGKGQPLNVVLENSMNPITTISLLYPFATTGNDGWLNSSILMRNVYIGLAPLIFVIYGLCFPTFSKNRENIFLFVCALVMLGLAWGQFFFFRQIAYYTLPLMKSFRHPALFRLFAVFCLLLLSAKSITAWQNNTANNRALKKILFTILVISISIAIVSILFSNNLITSNFFTVSNFKALYLKQTFSVRYLIQFLLFAPLLLATYFAIKKRKTQILFTLVIIDLFLATQLNMAVTIIGARHFTDVEKTMNRNIIKFPLPNNESITANAANSTGENVITGSTILYSKKITRNDYFITPGNLINQENFYESKIKDSVFKNSVLYFADTIIKEEKDIPYFKSKTAILRQFPDSFILRTDRDSNFVVINTLAANKMEATINNNNDGLLIYLQNNYKGWQAYVDDKKVEIFTVNKTFMAIQTPKGLHDIYFIYKPAAIINAWLISIIFMLLITITYCYLLFAKQKLMKRQMEVS